MEMKMTPPSEHIMHDTFTTFMIDLVGCVCVCVSVLGGGICAKAAV